MHQNVSLFRLYSMDVLKTPKGLKNKILISIRQEELRRARMYVFLSMATISASLWGIIFAVKYVLAGFYQTSFYSYFSLVFSDPDIAFSYWRELSFSLIEALPLLGITFSLIAVAILLTSVRFLAQNTKSNLAPLFSN
jgi:hypothetical protein